MAEQDALSNFNFDSVTGAGLYLKWTAGKPYTLRVLTVDPVVIQKSFPDPKTGAPKPSTQFAFIVYNFTEEKAQILQASPTVGQKIGDFHKDPDFGANIRNMDLKITPTGEGLERRYDIQVLRHSGSETKLTAAQVEEARAIDLDERTEGTRMSKFDEMQKANRAATKMDPAEVKEDLKKADIVIEDIGDEPINLDDIPF